MAFLIAFFIMLPLGTFILGFMSNMIDPSFRHEADHLWESVRFGLGLAGFALLLEGAVAVFILLTYGLMLIIQGVF